MNKQDSLCDTIETGINDDFFESLYQGFYSFFSITNVISSLFLMIENTPI